MNDLSASMLAALEAGPLLILVLKLAYLFIFVVAMTGPHVSKWYLGSG